MTSADASLTGPVEDPVEGSDDALHDLRRTRRHNRLAEVHWVDALYRVYITALLSVIFLLFAAGRLPDDRLSSQEAMDFVRNATPWLGLVFAGVLGIGLRSGGRGGPLVLEAPVVVHELNAPVNRGLALRSPAIKQLRFLAFIGTIAGGIVGDLAARRLSVNPVVAMVCCVVSFALVGVLASGAAMVLSGRRTRWFTANAIAAVFLAWSAVDIALHTETSPLTLLARIAFWPIEFDAFALIGVAFVVLVVVVGIRLVGGLSIEHAMRRAGLVSQLRFAVTLQDVRTVVLLRRQLSQERPRNKPWLHTKRGGRMPPVWRRDWQSILRFPAVRLVRMVLLGAAAGLALGLTWRGAPPMLVVAGLALYIAGYDAAEPIAQEVDHPTRWESFPHEPGRVLLQHTASAFVVMLLVCLVAAAASLVMVPATVVTQLTPVIILFAAGAAALAAAAGSAQGAPDVANMAGLGPDMMGFFLLGRLVLPPALVVAALAPLLGAGSDSANLQITRVQNGTTYVLFGLVAAFLWIRYRKPKHL